MPSLPTALFETLLREVITQLNSDLDISGSNTTLMSRTPRSQIENLIFSAMTEEEAQDSPQQNESLRPPIPSSRTFPEIIEEEPIPNTIPILSRSELYSFGEHYHRNTGDYISSINNSMALMRHLYITSSVNQGRRPSSRIGSNSSFYELDDIIYNYNSNFQGYNENVRLLLELFNNENIPPLPIPSVPLRTTLPPITIQPRTTPLNPLGTLTDFLNRPSNENLNTRLYMILPQRNTPPTPLSGVGLNLSVEQYDNSIERFIYRTTDTSGNEQERCPICFEDFVEGEFVTKILHCGHVFKTVQLNNWFLRSSTCPVCRYDLHANSTNAIGSSVDL